MSKLAKLLLALVCLTSFLFAAAQARSDWPATLRFGIIPVEGSADATARFAPLAAHLEAELGVPVEFDVGSDYAAVIIAMTSDQLDVAWFGADSYVQAHEQAGAEAFVVESNEASGTSYEGVIIASAESEIMNLANARDRTFAFTDPNSTSGYLVPEAYFLAEEGMLAEEYFTNVVFSGTHEASILGVLNGTIDLAATMVPRLDDTYEKGAATPEDFRVLWTSKAIPGFPIAYRSELPESFKAAVKEAFLSFDDPEGLELLGLSGYVETDDSAYDGIREVMATVAAAKD